MNIGAKMEFKLLSDVPKGTLLVSSRGRYCESRALIQCILLSHFQVRILLGKHKGRFIQQFSDALGTLALFPFLWSACHLPVVVIFGKKQDPGSDLWTWQGSAKGRESQCLSRAFSLERRNFSQEPLHIPPRSFPPWGHSLSHWPVLGHLPIAEPISGKGSGITLGQLGLLLEFVWEGGHFSVSKIRILVV